MKKFIVLIGLVFLLNTSVVFAKDKDYYIQITGLVVGSMSDADVSTDFGSQDDILKTKTAFGGAYEVGYKINESFSIGLEFSHRNFDLDTSDADEGRSNVVIYLLEDESDSIKVKTFMTNLTYEADFGNKIKPYLGAGIGIGRVSWMDRSSTEFAYQLRAGLGFQVTDSLNLFGGYRYLATTDGNVDNARVVVTDGKRAVGGILTGINYEVDIHNFELGIKYSF